MPGDVMAPRETCSCCGGTGQATAEAAQQYAEMVQATTGGYAPSSGTNSRSAYQIEADLRKAYEMLADLERQRDNCTSVTLKPQYTQMIIEQRDRISQLEAELAAAYR